MRQQKGQSKKCLITIKLIVNSRIQQAMPFVKVARKGEIKSNGGKEIDVNGTRVALFYARGQYFAIEALCRHQDGSLAPGKVDGEVVECPLHAWHYNIRTGELLDYLEGVKLATYKVDVRGDDVYIEI
jgi:nitrite reductase (NADH) small subunit